jgi:hypothetical protein
MKCKLFFLPVLLLAIFLSCNNDQKQMEEDALKLIKMEKRIVDLTIQLKKENNQALALERDSISDVLQDVSIELQKKYQEKLLLKEFQVIYDSLKRSKQK